MPRRIRIPLLLFLALAGAVGAGALWARAQLRSSLPQLEGRRQLPGLQASVRITRDALGIPTVHAFSRVDAARATGFLHAQDRFFQMDLARRRAAGELSALVGPRALPLDRDIRIHRFRAEARRALTLLNPADRELLDAYSAGVNAGLGALTGAPFEYLVLRQTPSAWRPEDTLLVVLSMFVTLQDDDGSYEATLATMHETLPPAMADFLAPAGSEWDTPIVGPAFPAPPIPGPDVYNPRATRKGKPPVIVPQQLDFERVDLGSGIWDSGFDDRMRESAALGSNSFAVSGRLTADGRALIANDMHLGIRVPNTWYRVALEWPDSAGGEPHRLSGVTLPGVPAVVVGSNSHVAWAFTNTYADWHDIVLLETDPARPDAYRTPGGWREFDRHEEVIQVAGESPVRQTVRWTIWGPLLDPDHRGRPRAYRWVAHDAERLAVSIRPFESATTIEEAFDEANGVGAPGQNILAADRSGRIGWSVYGSIPRRVGLDGRIPGSWADGSRRWDGWLDDAEYPRVLDPPDGRLWTANARVVDGVMLDRLGDGSYEIGSRARIIRDRLMSQNRFEARDLLAIQLDTNAEFLARWRQVVLDTLTPDESPSGSERAELRTIVETGWTGQAEPHSVAYRMVRAFREVASARVIAFVLSECYAIDPSFDYTTVRRRDAAIWRLVTGQPLHLLDPAYDTWRAFLLAAADETIAQAMRDRDGTLRDRVWSEYNATVYRHPLSGAIPIFGPRLDMPRAEVPGDLYTPRVQWGTIGASERMVVSPGNEAGGIMHMPTGQSGHPLSPFYANSHDAWITGAPTPFLPGATVHTLTLTP
jgi:penicillin amidase